jgi:hypothetical protein
MKVTEFLEQERAALRQEEERLRADAPDAYTAMTRIFPVQCKREFLDWLGDGADIPHDVFESILRRVASHNEVHDRLGISPAYAHLLAERWRESHRHE